MLYALAHPLSFVVLLASFVVGITLHGAVQGLLARRGAVGGSRAPSTTDPRRHVDPFGAVGAAVSGLGWGLPVELPRRKAGSAVLVALAGPAVNLVLGAAALVAFGVVYGGVDIAAPSLLVQRGSESGGQPLELALLLVGLSQLALGVLSLVPLPPLDGGRLLFALAPRSRGWQQAEYRLVEQNIGLAVVLALLIIPLGGPQPLLPQLLDLVLSPLTRVLTGG